MDFFSMNFSKLFLEKHGKEIFTTITTKILQKNSNDYDKDYIEIVFKIAFLDFLGLNDNDVKEIIKNSILNKDINIDEIKFINKDSIEIIQKYLNYSINKN